MHVRFSCWQKCKGSGSRPTWSHTRGNQRTREGSNLCKGSGSRPNDHTHAAMSAHEKGQQPERTRELLTAMQGLELEPITCARGAPPLFVRFPLVPFWLWASWLGPLVLFCVYVCFFCVFCVCVFFVCLFSLLCFGSFFPVPSVLPPGCSSPFVGFGCLGPLLVLPSAGFGGGAVVLRLCRLPSGFLPRTTYICLFSYFFF